MSQQQKNGNKHILIFIVSTLLVSWLMTFIFLVVLNDKKLGIGLISYIMLVPAAIAIILKKFEGKPIFKGVIRGTNFKSLAFGILFPVAFIFLCSIISIAAGLGRFDDNKLPDLRGCITILITIFTALIVGFGEEYGWRGYLLPSLTQKYGKIKASTIVGIVWGLYHAPGLYLLARLTGVGDPLSVAAVQACAAFAVSFSFAYCYYLSGSIFSVMIFHSIWNNINTRVLGDIYTNTGGIIEGNIFIINGEGVLGLVLGLIFMICVIWRFRVSSSA